jgi:hypothetical protein
VFSLLYRHFQSPAGEFFFDLHHLHIGQYPQRHVARDSLARPVGQLGVNLCSLVAAM